MNMKVLNPAQQMVKMGFVDTPMQDRFSPGASHLTRIDKGAVASAPFAGTESGMDGLAGLSLAHTLHQYLVWNVTLIHAQRDKASGKVPDQLELMMLNARGEYELVSTLKSQVASTLAKSPFASTGLSRLGDEGCEKFVVHMSHVFPEFQATTINTHEALQQHFIVTLFKALQECLDSPDRLSKKGFTTLEDEVRQLLLHEPHLIKALGIHDHWADRVNDNLALHMDILTPYFDAQTVLQLAQAPHYLLIMAKDRRFKRHLALEKWVDQLMKNAQDNDFFYRKSMVAAKAYRHYSKVITHSMRSAGHHRVKYDMIGRFGVGEYYRFEKIRDDYIDHLRHCMNDTLGLIAVRNHYGVHSQAFHQAYDTILQQRAYEGLNISQNASGNTSAFLKGVRPLIQTGKLNDIQDVAAKVDQYSNPGRFVRFLRDEVLAVGLFHAKSDPSSDAYGFYNMLQTVGLYGLTPRKETLTELEVRINTALNEFEMSAEQREVIREAVQPALKSVDNTLHQDKSAHYADPNAYLYKSFGIDPQQSSRKSRDAFKNDRKIQEEVMRLKREVSATADANERRSTGYRI